MRVRLRSELDSVVLGCWYEIPKSKDSYIEDLVQQLHSDLDLDFPSAELGLELEEFDLPRRSRIEGVLRDNDILTLKHISRSERLGKIERITNQFGERLEHDHITDETESIQNGSTDIVTRYGFEEEPPVSEMSTQLALVQEAASLKEIIKNQKTSLHELQAQYAEVKGVVVEREKHLEKLQDLLDKVHSVASLGPNTANTLEAPEATTDHNNAASDQPVEIVVVESDTDSSSDSASESDSSISETSSDESDSDSTTTTSSAASSSPVEETTSKVDPRSVLSQNAVILQGVPFQGSPSTGVRNERRKRQRTLQRLVLAGKLPPGSNFQALDKYLKDYGDVNAVANVRLPSGSTERPSTAVAVWDYPDEPEPGWEKRLIVKEVECEATTAERIVPVRQYEEEVERGRKRRRTDYTARTSNHESTVQADDVILHADMYGEAPIVTNGVASVHHSSTPGEAEEGEVVEDIHLANGYRRMLIDTNIPPLPENIATLPTLQLTSPYLSKPGTMIAFKYMEMRNFSPVISEYKTARIVDSRDEQLIMELAARDRDEPMYDYEGERVPGPFEVLDKNGNPIDGRLAINRGELMDVVLIAK